MLSLVDMRVGVEQARLQDGQDDAAASRERAPESSGSLGELPSDSSIEVASRGRRVKRRKRRRSLRRRLRLEVNWPYVAKLAIFYLFALLLSGGLAYAFVRAHEGRPMVHSS